MPRQAGPPTQPGQPKNTPADQSTAASEVVVGGALDLCAMILQPTASFPAFVAQHHCRTLGAIVCLLGGRSLHCAAPWEARAADHRTTMFGRASPSRKRRAAGLEAGRKVQSVEAAVPFRDGWRRPGHMWSWPADDALLASGPVRSGPLPLSTAIRGVSYEAHL